MGKTKHELTPLGDRLLLRQTDNVIRQTESGIVLPDSAVDRQRYRMWEVVAVGAEVRDEALLPGAQVIVRQYGGTPTVHRQQNYTIVSEGDVYAIVED